MPSNKMDKECVRLCESMNRWPGIRTVESCSGHTERPFRIWFDVDNLGDLPHLLYWFDG